ncbi:MAG: Gfo/Idh/MocA family oxidoreductase, partial [Armatimonadota bacterium]
GTVILEDGKMAFWNVEGVPRPDDLQTDFGSGASDPTAISSLGHQAQINDLVQAINENRPPVVDGREARKAIEIIAAIYKSAKSGRQVLLAPCPGGDARWESISQFFSSSLPQRYHRRSVV